MKITIFGWIYASGNCLGWGPLHRATLTCMIWVDDFISHVFLPQAPKKAKRRQAAGDSGSSNVFSMFEQSQIQEYKEVRFDTLSLKEAPRFPPVSVSHGSLSWDHTSVWAYLVKDSQLNLLRFQFYFFEGATKIRVWLSSSRIRFHSSWRSSLVPPPSSPFPI